MKAKTRDPGKKLGTLRASGEIPAVLYGPDVEATPLAVRRRDFLRAFAEAGESSLIRLSVDADGTVKPFVVLIRDVQRDALSDQPQHADFHAVRLNEVIKIDVPLVFVGSSPAESRGEAVVTKELHELEVEALPEKLPHEIEVDIASLENVDDAIHVSDLTLPDGVRTAVDPATVVVRAAPLMSEEEIGELEGAPEEGVPEVEGEVKEGEEEAEAVKGKESPATEEVSG